MPKLRDRQGRFIKSSNGNGAPTFNAALIDLIENAQFSRQQFFKRFFDPRRDINKECGFLETSDLTPVILKDMYDREAVATRVVEVLPMESWAVQPTVLETDDVDQVTAFEQAWEELGKNLLGDSWYEDEEGNPIWEYLQRVDVLSGIGAYGVLLIGVDDEKALNEPLDGIDDQGRRVGNVKGRKLIYLRAFDEALAQITRYEQDKTNPRYGQPVEYNLTFSEIQQGRFSVQPAGNINAVHWSRVIHVADNLGSSEVFGVSRMRPVWNNLYSLRKLYAGCAEMYWKGAFPGLSFETHPQLQGDLKIDVPGMKAQMEDYQNGLQRYLSTVGHTVNSLAPQVVDPTPQIDTHIQAICIRNGIPKRIFTGSERGELASSQDEETWNDRLHNRQTTYLTPRIVVPFVDRLIIVGVLPEPESYNAIWPDLNTLTDQEKAEVALKRTESLAKYVGGNVEAVFTPLDFLTRILGLTQDEASAVLEATVEAEPLPIPRLDSEIERAAIEEVEVPKKIDGPIVKKETPPTKNSFDDDLGITANQFDLSPSEEAVVRTMYEESIHNDDGNTLY